jgi:hypothetical protein
MVYTDLLLRRLWSLKPGKNKFVKLNKFRQRKSKRIVSRVWEQLQWNPSDRSEEFRTAGAYFYSLLMPFLCFNSKKAYCGGFSFDSNSANDE